MGKRRENVVLPTQAVYPAFCCCAEPYPTPTVLPGPATCSSSSLSCCCPARLSSLVRPAAVPGIELMCWAGIWACSSVLLALPVELYLYAFSGQGIPTHHLGILFETSPAEAIEFLVSKVWLLAGLFVGVLAWLGAGWRAAWTTRDLDWSDVSRSIVLGLLAHWARLPFDLDALSQAAMAGPITTTRPWRGISVR
jgi:hypothetical protein